MKEEALKYYKIGFQFLNVSELLLDKLIEKGNTNFLISENEISEEELHEETKYSDFNVIIPILFNYYHGMELIIKGLLINVGRLNNYSHKIEKLIQDLKNENNYEENFKNLILKLWENPIELVNTYKSQNDIKDIIELYNSLRYPINNNKVLNYSNLMFNNEEILEQCKELIANINEVKIEVVKRYREF